MEIIRDLQITLEGFTDALERLLFGVAAASGVNELKSDPTSRQQPIPDEAGDARRRVGPEVRIPEIANELGSTRS
jgi:hypothetical protein